MKRLFALTAAVWVSATISATALAFWLGTPPKPPALKPIAPLTIAAALPAAIDLGKTMNPEADVLVVPEIAIVAPRPRPYVVKAAPPPPPKPRDISEMRCSEWVDLQQGPEGHRVQYCE